MRKLVSIFLFAVSLIAGPAFAQQHPWVPSSVYAGTLSNDAPARASSRSIRGSDISPRHSSVNRRHQGDTK
jgi:hypothetical protein